MRLGMSCVTRVCGLVGVAVLATSGCGLGTQGLTDAAVADVEPGDLPVFSDVVVEDLDTGVADTGVRDAVQTDTTPLDAGRGDTSGGDVFTADGGHRDASSPGDATTDHRSPDRPADSDGGVTAPVIAICPGTPEPPTGDGFHCIEIPQAGFTDRVWIKAVSPPGDGPFPVVVHGKGQGGVSSTNCHPDGYPNIEPAFVDDLVGRGYLVITIGYRHDGAGISVTEPLRYRDHYVFDARAFLAAAQWGRQSHGKGESKVAFIGGSMGTWPATWAVSHDERLIDLQAGLDVRTVVLAAESANHLANYADLTERWATGTVAGRAEVVGSVAVISLRAHATDLGLEEIYLADLTTGPLAERLAVDLTPLAIEFLEAVRFQLADPGLEGCSNLAGRLSACSSACASASALKFAEERALDATIFDSPANWVKSSANETISFWEPPARTVPDAEDLAANSLLRAVTEQSPAYSAQGPLLTQRVLHLLSTQDSHWSAEARALLGDKLMELGVQTLTTPDISTDGLQPDTACTHMNYEIPERPACGYGAIVEELATAMQ